MSQGLEPESASAPPAAPSRGLELLKDSIRIAATRYLSRGLLLIKTLLVARWLEPAGYGLVGVVALIPLYGMFAELGQLGAIGRELPRLGSSPADQVRRQELVDTGASYISLLSMLAALGVAVYAMLEADPVRRWATILAGLVIPAQQGVAFFQTLLRVRQSFAVIARSTVILEISGLGYTLAGVYFFGVAGFFGALLLANLTALVWLTRQAYRAGERVHVSLHWRVGLGLLVAGIPLTAVYNAHTFVLSLDRLVMSRTLDEAVIGQYLLALLVAGVIQYVPDAVGYILFPILRQRTGDGMEDRAARLKLLREPTEGVAWVITFFIAGAVLALPVLPLLLPAYAPGVEPARVLTLFTFFPALTTVALAHLTALERAWIRLVIFQAVVSLAGALALWAAIRAGGDVTAVAWTMGGVYAAYGLGTQALALRHCGLTWSEILKDFIRLCIPVLYLGLSLQGIHRAVAWLELKGAAAAFAEVGLFLPLSVPLVWGLLRRTPLLALLRRFREKRLARA